MKKTLLTLVAGMAAGLGLSMPDVPAYRRRKAKTNRPRSSANRYTPHQGKQEIARRKRQLERGQISQWRPFVFPEAALAGE